VDVGHCSLHLEVELGYFFPRVSSASTPVGSRNLQFLAGYSPLTLPILSVFFLREHFSYSPLSQRCGLSGESVPEEGEDPLV